MEHGARKKSQLSRRELLQRGAAGGLFLGIGGLAAACGAGGGGGSASSTSVSTTAASSAASTAASAPQNGGTLRVGLVGGSAADEKLDPHVSTVNTLDLSRTQNVFSKLTDMTPDGAFEMQLAESMEPNSTADEWVVKLKQGVVWQDGSPLTADDVVFTYQRILDPANKLDSAASNIDMIDPNGIEKIDDLTVRLKLVKPWAELPAQVGQRYVSIVKAGTTEFTLETLNGTGPFKLESWKPGEQYVLVRNDNYFQEGEPHVDRVEVNGINDATARLNALQSGQVDAVAFVDPSQVKVVEGNKDLALLISEGGGWVPIYMNTQQAPFTDVRVRQAMKLLADREKLVEVALQGYGAVGNDLFAVADPLYAADIPQRGYDPEQAVSLLKAAGVDGMEFILHSSEATPSMLSSALVYSQSAKDAGVNVTVKKHPVDSFWSEVYGKVPFGYSDWGYRPFLSQWVQSFQSFNESETNWVNEQAASLVDEVAATPDPAKRKELATEAQQLLWDDGGYIIWGFAQKIDAHSTSVQGIQPHIFNPLGWYAFKDAMIV